MAKFEIEFKSKRISKSSRIIVFLPCDDELEGVKTTPYKTLYFLTHYTGNVGVLESFLPFRTQSLLSGTAVVLIEGDNSFYIDRPQNHANYASYIMEIVELTRKYFPTLLSVRREDTFLGGASMGGYGAMVNAVRLHQVFGKIVAFSPVIRPYDMVTDGIFPMKLVDDLFKNNATITAEEIDVTGVIWEAYQKGQLPKLFVCCGMEDELVGCQVQSFIHFLTEKNIPGEYILTTGGHDVLYWGSMLGKAMSFCQK